MISLEELFPGLIENFSPFVPFVMMLIMYFFFVRVLLRANMVGQRKMTKKERKAHNKERWNRTKKESFKAFWKWLLCKCYVQEQKGDLYIPFVVINYIYLLRIAISVLLWILSGLIPIFWDWLAVFCGLTFSFLDSLVILLETIFVFRSKLR